MSQLIGNDQIRHPVTFGKAIGVVLCRLDIGFQMHVRILCRAHHAFRLHFDGLEINRSDLHPPKQLRLADGNFLGLRTISKGEAERHHERSGSE